MVNNDLYIGLDVGTDSVGWACTDENYNLCRIKGKTAWGVRIFDQAKDSKTRRTFRSNKRRQNRRKYRISLLDSLFAKPIKARCISICCSMRSKFNQWLRKASVLNLA